MHKIFKVQITAFGPEVIVIVTALQNAGGYFKAESFCVFPEPHPGHAFTEIRFDQKSFSGSPVELTNEFMLEEALGQAKIDIAQHLESHYSGKELMAPLGDLRLKEAGIELLVHRFVRGTGDFLWDIQNRTNCEDLRSALEPLLKLPTLKTTKID